MLIPIADAAGLLALAVYVVRPLLSSTLGQLIALAVLVGALLVTQFHHIKAAWCAMTRRRNVTHDIEASVPRATRRSTRIRDLRRKEKISAEEQLKFQQAYDFVIFVPEDFANAFRDPITGNRIVESSGW